MNDSYYNNAPIEDLYVKRYRESMDAVVKAFKQAGVRQIVVGSPGVVDAGGYKGDAAIKNENLHRFAGIAREVAEENGVDFANLHELMMDVMSKAKAKYGDGYFIAKDGVHPEMNGHLIMAYAFLKALKCPGDIGTLTYDWKRDKATATPGHKILSAARGTLEIESSKYPFYLTGPVESPDGTRGITEFFPFNEDLNRFMLVVKNAPTSRMKVTWGEDSKTFTAAELERGINLPAEFPEHPFREPFLAVYEKIAEKQAFETTATKTLLHRLPHWQTHLPEQADAVRALEAGLLQKHAALQRQAREAVKPFQHRLVIAPN